MEYGAVTVLPTRTREYEHGNRSLHLLVILGKTTRSRLAIERWEIFAGLFHYFYQFVERHTMTAICEITIDIGIQCPGGRVCVAFDAGYLHQTAHRVASHTEVMLQAHLRCILYLGYTAAEKLTGGRSGHSAGHTYLSLTTYFGTTDTGVLLHDIAEKCGCGKRMEDMYLWKITTFPYMIKHSGEHTARSERGGGHDSAATGIFLAGRERISEYKSAAA